LSEYYEMEIYQRTLGKKHPHLAKDFPRRSGHQKQSIEDARKLGLVAEKMKNKLVTVDTLPAFVRICNDVKYPLKWWGLRIAVKNYNGMLGNKCGLVSFLIKYHEEHTELTEYDRTLMANIEQYRGNQTWGNLADQKMRESAEGHPMQGIRNPATKYDENGAVIVNKNVEKRRKKVDKFKEKHKDALTKEVAVRNKGRKRLQELFFDMSSKRYGKKSSKKTGKGIFEETEEKIKKEQKKRKPGVVTIPIGAMQEEVIVKAQALSHYSAKKQVSLHIADMDENGIVQKIDGFSSNLIKAQTEKQIRVMIKGDIHAHAPEAAASSKATVTKSASRFAVQQSLTRKGLDKASFSMSQLASKLENKKDRTAKFESNLGRKLDKRVEEICIPHNYPMKSLNAMTAGETELAKDLVDGIVYLDTAQEITGYRLCRDLINATTLYQAQVRRARKTHKDMGWETKRFPSKEINDLKLACQKAISSKKRAADGWIATHESMSKQEMVNAIMKTRNKRRKLNEELERKEEEQLEMFRENFGKFE